MAAYCRLHMGFLGEGMRMARMARTARMARMARMGSGLSVSSLPENLLEKVMRGSSEHAWNLP